MFRTIAEKLVYAAVFVLIGFGYTHCVHTFAFSTAIG